MTDGRELHITERPQVPILSVLLGYGPMLPLTAGAIIAWTPPGPWRDELVFLSIVWGATILSFLAGVRRGLSFRTEDGPTLTQLVTMLSIFLLGLASLVALFHHRWVLASVFQIAAFALIALVDPIAARAGEAPLFFARLRPIQMAIAVISLIALTVGLVVAIS